MASERREFTVNDIPQMSLGEFILQRMRKYGDLPALIDGTTEQTYSYSEVVSRVERVAAGLQRLGVKTHDVIAILAPNHLDYPITFYAVALLNATLQPLNPLLTQDDIKKCVVNCQPKFFVTMTTLLPKVKKALENHSNIKVILLDGVQDGCVGFESLTYHSHGSCALPACDPKHDVVALMSSSGTTGFPKSVQMTHYSIVANILQINEILRFKPDDSMVVFLPMFHVYGLNVITAQCHSTGTRVIVMPRFEPVAYMQLIEKYKPRVLHVVPPIMVMFAKHPKVTEFDLSCVKMIICGAAPLSNEIEDIVRNKLNLEFIFQGYGMTEAGVTHLNSDEHWRHKSVGRLLPLAEVKIIDVETQTPVKVNEEGEVWLKGPQVSKGYLNLPEQTRDMFQADGWVKTGDVGREDENGFLYIVDRVKELIKYKAFQVAPATLEDILLRHEAVADAGVVGMPDEEAGELPRAYVVRKPDKDVTEEEIVDFVAQQVAPFMKLRGGVEFIDAIPRTASGKILRRDLRDKARALVQK